MILISHKGVGDQNTIPAIQKAIEMGYLGIEFDVLTTYDNILVLAHDNNLSERTGIDIKISDMNSQKLSEIRTKSGNKIPTLSETMDILNNTKIDLLVVIDPKSEKSFRLCRKFFDKKSYNLEIILGRPVISLNFECISINSPNKQIYHKPPWILQLFKKYPNSLAWTVNNKNLYDKLDQIGVYGIITDNILP